MNHGLILNVAALLALLPISLFSARPGSDRGKVFWWLMAVAVAGPLVWTLLSSQGDWHADLSSALWVSATLSLLIFGGAALLMREVWKLTPLFAPLMLLIAFIATVWRQSDAAPVYGAGGEAGWLWIHILVSVSTYALLTIAAVAALAAILQERALKRKRVDGFARRLPSVIDCEQIVIRFLWSAEGVLFLGLASGMALNLAQGASALVLDHKTVLSFGAFAVIGVLLIAHSKSGVRGRRAARFVLLAYLLMTLAYPGVKFVTDVLLA